MFKDSIRHKCNRLFPRSTHLNPVPFSPSDVPLLPLSLHGGCLAAPACSDGAGPDQHRLYWIWELPSVPAGRRSMAMATARSGRRRGRGRCRRTSDSTTRITTGRLKLLLPHGTADARAPPPFARHRSLRALLPHGVADARSSAIGAATSSPRPPAWRRGCALLRRHDDRQLHRHPHRGRERLHQQLHARQLPPPVHRPGSSSSSSSPSSHALSSSGGQLDLALGGGSTPASCSSSAFMCNIIIFTPKKNELTRKNWYVVRRPSVRPPPRLPTVRHFPLPIFAPPLRLPHADLFSPN
jgi:hypothetical protein